MGKKRETRRGPKPFSLGRSTRRPVAFGRSCVVPLEYRGEPFAVGRREGQQGVGELRQRIALVDRFVLPLLGVGVHVFGFAGASTGASAGKR